MGLGIADMKAVIYAKVGQGLEGDDEIDSILIDKIDPLFDTLWAKWSWKSFYPQLQFLYVQRECVEILMGQMRDLIDTKLGTNLTNNQSLIFTNLAKLYANVDTQITQAELEAKGARGPAVGELRKKNMGGRREPWLPDPNSPIYRGDPLAPTPFVTWDA